MIPGFPTEPGAEIRNFAHATREVYVAFTETGFTEAQALILTREWVRAIVLGGSSGEGGGSQ